MESKTEEVLYMNFQYKKEICPMVKRTEIQRSRSLCKTLTEGI
jgi:hypothetical protein